MKTFLLLAAALAVSVGVSLALLESTGSGTPPAYSWSEGRNVARDTRELDEAVLGVRRYQAELRRTTAALLDGSLSLPEAGERLAGAAAAHNPSLLKALEHIYPGRTAPEQMILSLLRRLTIESERGLLTPEQAERVACLRTAHEREAGTFPSTEP